MNKKISAIGEVLLDVYGKRKMFGGAPFNFIYHMNKFNQISDIITCLGNDIDGEKILNFMRDEDISTKYIKIHSSKKTGRVLVRLNKDKVPNYSIKTDVAYDFIELTEIEKQQIIKNSGIIYFGSLSQRNNVSRKTIQSLLSNRTINFCDLNLRQSFYSKELIETSLKKCDILKLNEEELKLVSHLFFGRSSLLKIDVLKLIEYFEMKLIAVTLGERGARLFSRNESVTHKPKQIPVLDTVGAGDAYSAILALGVLNNCELKRINKLAVSFASEVCQVKGALLYNTEIYNKYKELLFNGK